MPNRSVDYTFRGNFTNLRTGLVAAGRGVDDFGRKLTAADANGVKMRRGLTDIGNTAGRIGLVAGAGLAAVVGVTANFEKSMSSVAAATGEGEEAMKALRDAAIQAGAETAFSASEAAAGIENLAKAGVATQDILGGGLQGALDLAAAGELEVADAAEAAASAMSQFGLKGEDVPHIADLLAAAAGKAQGEVSDMAQALNQSGIVADQVGLSIEETTGGLAAFAEAGLIGSDAGTSFKTMLGSLTPSSVKAKETMEDLGISAYDAQGNFVGLAEFAGNLQSSLSDLSVEQRNAALKTIFGSDAIRAATLLYENGQDGIEGWIEKVDDSGFAAETAKTKLDNLSGDLEALRGSLETALIGAGSGSQGPLRKLAQTLTDVINGFNNLPAPAQGATTALLGITAIFGGGLWFTSKVVTGIANTRQALGDLGVTASGAKGRLAGLARTASRLFVVAAGVTAIDQALSAASDTELDTSDLARNLEAIGQGDSTDTLDRIIEDLEILSSVEDPFVGTGEKIQDVGQTIISFGQATDTAADKASNNISAIDEALAGLVESGSGDQAIAIFDAIMSRLALEGGSQVAFQDQLDSFFTALDNADAAADGAADSTDDLAGATDGLGDSADKATPKIDKMRTSIKDAKGEIKDTKEALRDARDAAYDTAGEFFGLGDKVDKAKVSLSEWIDDLEDQAEALREFRENAEAAAENGLDRGLIASLQELGPEGARRMRQLATASEDEIDRVNAAWRDGKREMGKYVDQVTGPLKEALDRLQDRLKNLRDRLKELEEQQDIRINVTVAHREIGAQFNANNIDLDRLQTHARGGLVTGAGGPTEDRIPAMLSNREYVVKAAAVQKYGVHFFDQANAMRLAQGGPVQRSAHAPAVASSIDYDRLAMAMLRARPLYGDVHISGDPTTFKRELAADARRTAIGGLG